MDAVSEKREVFTPSREGMIMTAAGTEYPRANVQAQVLLAHDFTNRLVDTAKALQELMLGQKDEMWADIDLYQNSLLSIYHTRRVNGRDGARGTMTITTMDQLRKVTVTLANYEAVTGAVLAAQSLVNQVLDDLTEGIDPGIRALLNNAFVRDERTGHISVERLKGLKKINLDHRLWADALKAIDDSVETISSKLQLRFYERDKTDGVWSQIALQFSAL
jgi:Protein of unknown function (DUF3164)